MSGSHHRLEQKHKVSLGVERNYECRSTSVGVVVGLTYTRGVDKCGEEDGQPDETDYKI